MSILYERYNTGDDGGGGFHDVTWYGQTFTPAIAHKITSVKLKLYRGGLPGIITVSIRTTDENDHPTGEDLCSGTTDGDTLPGSPGEWREITLGDGCNLDADTKYAIVIRALTGDASNIAYSRQDQSSPTYDGGCRENSGNSGSTWTSRTDRDLMFEDWGEEIAVVAPTVTTQAADGIGFD